MYLDIHFGNVAKIFTGFWINYAASNNISEGHTQWLLAFAVQLIPGGLLMLGAPFLIESPRWLMSRDRKESSLACLSSLRGLSAEHEFVRREYSETEEAIVHERSLAGAGFFGPMQTVFSNRKLIWRLFLGMSLFAWQNATGINAINYYA